MSKGICISGPEQGRTVSMEGDLYKAAWPLDWSQRRDLDPTLPEDPDSQVFVYRFHMMAVADKNTYTDSARHAFWVPQDEKEPNKLILEYLLDCQSRVVGRESLAARAYKVIDWLMPGLKHISIPDYAELNEVLMGLRKIKDDNL